MSHPASNRMISAFGALLLLCGLLPTAHASHSAFRSLQCRQAAVAAALGVAMQEEAEDTINGKELYKSVSFTTRVRQIDTSNSKLLVLFYDNARPAPWGSEYLVALKLVPAGNGYRCVVDGKPVRDGDGS
jgi:hypothetical protein